MPHPRASRWLPQLHGAKHSIGTQNGFGMLNIFGSEIARRCLSTDAAGLPDTKRVEQRRRATTMEMI